MAADVPSPPVIVVAPALPAPLADRVLLVDDIGARELQNAPSTQLDELLKTASGLQLFRRSDARSAHPTSQGVTLRALGGNASSRALLVLDGVPQSDPFGGWVNWPAYDPAALAAVRVVRGGGSVAHGAGALAGTIEMRSAIGRGTDASLEAGSRASAEARIHAVLGGGLSIAARVGRGDGFVPVTGATRGPVDRRAPYRQASLRAQLTRPVWDDVDVQLSASAFHDSRERGVAFTDNRTKGADASIRLVGSGRLPWSVLAYGQWRGLRSSFASVNVDRTQASRASLQDAVPSSGFGSSIELRPQLGTTELRIGGDVRATAGESRELFNYVAGEPTRRRLAGGETLNGGAFAELAVPLNALTLSAGVRIDHWRIRDGRLQEWQIADGAVLRDEAYRHRSGWHPTARMGAAYDVNSVLSLRSAAYLGWRLPTLNELFRPFRAGRDATAANALLDPERLAGIEAGLRLTVPAVTLEGTIFATRLRDSIANVTLGAGPGAFPAVGFVPAGGEYRQRLNVDALAVRGVELSAEAQRGQWSVRFGYSLADAALWTSGSASSLDGLRPAQTPRHVGTASVNWADGGQYVSLSVRHVGAQFEDDGNTRKLPTATTLDMFAAVPVTASVSLFARAENLLNAQVLAGIAADGTQERSTPQTLLFGLRLQRVPADR